ncbi:MAG: MFS transporter, partial [Chloroflexi bacterium]|nr:MFS transporter [Chloroflexota bacterium]
MISTRFPAFASRDYRLFWSGQAISLVGTWMQSTVQPYLAYRLTGQPIFLGVIGFATTLPTLLLTLPGGVLVERLDKRRVVIVMQTVMMLQAFALGALAFSGHISIWHIAALAFVLGAANSIEITARQSLMIELVGKEALPNAIALNSTIFNAARVLGPMASAPFLVLLKDNGEGWAFLANGVSYLFVIVSLLLIRTRTPPIPAPKGVSGMAQFREGQRYVARTPVVRLLVTMAAMLGLVGVPFSQ